MVLLTDRLQTVADAVAIARRIRTIAMQGIVAGLTLSGAAMAAAALRCIKHAGAEISLGRKAAALPAGR